MKAKLVGGYFNGAELAIEGVPRSLCLASVDGERTVDPLLFHTYYIDPDTAFAAIVNETEAFFVSSELSGR